MAGGSSKPSNSNLCGVGHGGNGGGNEIRGYNKISEGPRYAVKPGMARPLKQCSLVSKADIRWTLRASIDNCGGGSASPRVEAQAISARCRRLPARTSNGGLVEIRADTDVSELARIYSRCAAKKDASLLPWTDGNHGDCRSSSRSFGHRSGGRRNHDCQSEDSQPQIRRDCKWSEMASAFLQPVKDAGHCVAVAASLGQKCNMQQHEHSPTVKAVDAAVETADSYFVYLGPTKALSDEKVGNYINPVHGAGYSLRRFNPRANTKHESDRSKAFLDLKEPSSYGNQPPPHTSRLLPMHSDEHMDATGGVNYSPHSSFRSSWEHRRSLLRRQRQFRRDCSSGILSMHSFDRVPGFCFVKHALNQARHRSNYAATSGDNGNTNGSRDDGHSRRPFSYFASYPPISHFSLLLSPDPFLISSSCNRRGTTSLCVPSKESCGGVGNGSSSLDNISMNLVWDNQWPRMNAMNVSEFGRTSGVIAKARVPAENDSDCWLLREDQAASQMPLFVRFEYSVLPVDKTNSSAMATTEKARSVPVGHTRAGHYEGICEGVQVGTDRGGNDWFYVDPKFHVATGDSDKNEMLVQRLHSSDDLTTALQKVCAKYRWGGGGRRNHL